MSTKSNLDEKNIDLKLSYNELALIIWALQNAGNQIKVNQGYITDAQAKVINSLHDELLLAAIQSN